MRILDLFSGIGGFSLGLERAGMQTIAFCENNKFCQKVLRKHWPDVPIFDDIRTLKGDDIEQPIDILTGGFPCQPYSVAGKQKGSADDRALWPEMFRLVQEVKPTWVLAENVAGIINMVLDDVLADLEGTGYETETFIIPACGVGAPHRRDRVWIVAHSTGSGIMADDGIRKPMELSGGKQKRRNRTGDSGENVGNAKKSSRNWKTSGQQQGKAGRRNTQSETICHSTIAGLPNWAGGEMEQPCPITEFKRSDGREVERNFCGVSYGVSRRVDRLRSLGNAVVPQIVEVLGRAIMAIEKDS